jgi:glutaminase
LVAKAVFEREVMVHRIRGRWKGILRTIEEASTYHLHELQEKNAKKFGMALQAIDGRLFRIGDADEKFSIQSFPRCSP